MNDSSISDLSPAWDLEDGLSGWNFSYGKRVLDASCAAVGLVVSLPVMGMIALAIRVGMPGPVLFRQVRGGRDGKTFQIFKFRTMRERKHSDGPSVTRKGDSRITPLGRFLRQFKLDELPQLFNVLRGDMSLVGPRPDVPEFCRSLGAEHQAIFALKPGLTGWATLHFRDEEGVLANVPQEQVSNYYVTHILPAKAQLDLNYARRATFLGDLGIVLRTLTRIHP